MRVLHWFFIATVLISLLVVLLPVSDAKAGEVVTFNNYIAPQPQARGKEVLYDTPASSSNPMLTSAHASSMLRMNMKSYGNHDELSYSDTLGNVPYDQRILAIKPEIVIDNPPHGLYGEMENPKYTASWLLHDISGYHAAGIKIIGYISGGYEGKGGDDHYAPNWYSLSTNKMLITNMATIDHVDGVFIDECSDYPNAASKSYLTDLSNLAHSYGLIVWMNVGVDDFDEWYFTVADFMQSSEAWVGQDLTSVQQRYGSRIGVTGFNSSYTAQDAYRLTIDAWNKGIAYCYINTAEYTSIAPWFEEYAQMLREAPGGEVGGGCFIATAAYGSYLDSHVQVLRAFRDRYLLTNSIGSWLVSTYYELSPPLAQFLENHPAFKPVVRVGLLPAVAISTLAVSTPSAEKMAILGSLVMIGTWAALWFRKRAGLG
jgi:hypothetical protein